MLSVITTYVMIVIGVKVYKGRLFKRWLFEKLKQRQYCEKLHQIAEL